MTAVSGKKNGQNFSGSYTYDKAGNPTSYFNPGDLSTWTLSWKNGRELGKAVKSGTTLSFDYDVNGLRTWKQVDGVRHNYTYASGLLLRESYSQNGTDYTLDFLYDLNNRPYMLYLTTKTGSATTSKPYYYILNLQGDVVHLVNTAGKAMASYTYDPYGAILTKSGELADLNPIRYRGYYYDTETGFYYLQSRYYDPALGRFINADSYTATGIGYLGYNMFAYCNNSPIITCDKNGQWLNIVIGAVVGAVVNVVSAALIEKKPLDEVLVSGIAGAVGGGLAACGFGGLAGAATSLIDSAYGNTKAVMNGEKSVGEALLDTGINTALGAAFGAMGSGSKAAVKESMEISKAGFKGFKTVVAKKVFKKATHPAVTNAAKRALKTAAKYAVKELKSNVFISGIGKAVTLGTAWTGQKVYQYCSTH